MTTNSRIVAGRVKGQIFWSVQARDVDQASNRRQPWYLPKAIRSSPNEELLKIKNCVKTVQEDTTVIFYNESLVSKTKKTMKNREGALSDESLDDSPKLNIPHTDHIQI